MGIFSWRRSEPEVELHPDLIKRLDALEAANAKLEKRMDGLDVEWSEWFDKFRLLYARISKRVREAAAAAADPAEDTPQSRQDAPRSTIPRAVGYDRPFTPAPKPRGNYT